MRIELMLDYALIDGSIFTIISIRIVMVCGVGDIATRPLHPLRALSWIQPAERVYTNLSGSGRQPQLSSLSGLIRYFAPSPA